MTSELGTSPVSVDRKEVQGKMVSMRYIALLLVCLVSGCVCQPETAKPETTFEQQTLAIEIGMTADQVVSILGPADSTETAEDGGEVWSWRRRAIGSNIHDARLSFSKFRNAEVTFFKGSVASVHYEYRLVH